MTGRFTVLAIAAVLVLAAARAAVSGAVGDIGESIRGAQRAAEPSYHLMVHRTSREGQRSLEVFPSGTAIWDRRAQIRLPAEARVDLLEILDRHGFAAMAPSYGGAAKPGLKQAALRITCRVELELEGLSKSSLQLADGPQSAALAALADALLDVAEPLVAGAVTAGDLADGLRKLADGRLAAEVLQLRFVRLPEDGVGEILSISDGEESRKAYAPGRRIGGAEVSNLGPERLAAVVKALLEADVASLPVNLWSADHVELEVGLLGHRTTVIGRDFRRLSSAGETAARKRFERLVDFLGEAPGSP